MQMPETAGIEKEESMIHAIGETTMQQIVRPNYQNDLLEKELAVKKGQQIREQRPIEKSDGSQKAKLKLKSHETTRSRNSLEDGKIVVEKYDADGKLLKKIPPGYLPFGEMA